eukprot:gb/GECH01006240.1/.p1 GENE.gb/GECH01006240.1/~~gb/GECH01006240.1/.p1  ORF type:complete len:495 (+),score=108.27 gb/GECH01006240.1/:1-1485(+)
MLDSPSTLLTSPNTESTWKDKLKNKRLKVLEKTPLRGKHAEVYFVRHGTPSTPRNDQLSSSQTKIKTPNTSQIVSTPSHSSNRRISNVSPFTPPTSTTPLKKRSSRVKIPLSKRSPNSSTPSNAKKRKRSSLNQSKNTSWSPKAQLVVKRQRLEQHKDVNDSAYRELMILDHLTTSVPNKHCTNFVRMVDWFKSKEEDGYFMNMVLEHGGTSTLSQHKTLSLHLFKSIVIQILFALHTLQQQCGLVHHDLHFGNILLTKQNEGDAVILRDASQSESACWRVEHVLVKITDFGLSRADVSGRTVHNTKDPITASFSTTADLASLAQGLRKITIDYSTCSQPDEAKKSVRSFKRKLSQASRQIYTSTTPLRLMQHPVFDDLRSIPAQPSPHAHVAVSTPTGLSATVLRSPNHHQDRQSLSRSTSTSESLFHQENDLEKSKTPLSLRCCPSSPISPSISPVALTKRFEESPLPNGTDDDIITGFVKENLKMVLNNSF